PYIIPAAYAQGGEVIEESTLLCTNPLNTKGCDVYSEPYSVQAWKKGLRAVKEGFNLLGIPSHFKFNRKDAFHYVLFSHALATFDPNTGLPLTAGLNGKDPKSVSGVADRPGGDVMITLGLWRTDDPAGCNPVVDCADQTGSSIVQAGTFMHELG